MGKPRHTQEFVEQRFNEVGYTVTGTYININTPISFTCDKGHQTEMKFAYFLTGSRCPICFGTPKKTQEEVEQIYASKQHKVLGIYQGNLKKLEVFCPNNHTFQSRLADFQNGHGCPYCAKVRVDFKDIEEAFRKVKYKLLTKKEGYINIDGRLNYICDHNHISYTTWHNFKQGSKCITCHIDSTKTNLVEIITLLEKEGYKYISGKYKNAFSKIGIECPKGHRWKVMWNSFQQGARCPKCQTKESKAEIELRDFLKEINPNIILDPHNREICTPYEVDIYLPEYKLGIEYNGIYWHSTAREKYRNDYKLHQKKFLAAKEKGIRLIQIFEDEWLFKQDIVKSRLRHILNLSVNKVYARNCEVKEITSKEANMFCKKYHIQGKGKVNFAFGLYTTSNEQKELCSVMTFAKPNIAKGGKNKDFIELSRFCSSISVVGGANRLFQAFIKKYTPKQIISFCDLRWGSGRVYEKLGMKLESITKPNYYYVEGKKRKHRYSFRKSELIRKYGADPNKTEKEITEELQLLRIYDAGNYKFIWDSLTR